MKPGLQQVCACLLTVLDVSEGLAFPKAPPCPNADSKTFRKLDVEIFNLTDIYSTTLCGWKQLRRVIAFNIILLVSFSK